MNFVKKHVALSILILIILLSLLFILGETAVREVAQYVPPASTQTAAVSGAGSELVAHYTFDDATGADATGGNNGIVSGGPSVVAGKIGSGALSFDGVDDYIGITHTAALNPAALSISFWVLFDACPASSNNSFLDKGNSAGYRVRFSTNCQAQFLSSGGILVTSNNGASASTWTHFVIISDGSGTKIYRNGVLDRTNSTAFSAPQSTSGISIGTGTGGAIKVQADDLRIYSRVLDVGEVGELYALGGSVAPPPPPENPPANPNPPTNPPADNPPPSNPPADPSVPVVVGTGPLWYVDTNATGANNGVSWADAWKNTTDIKWNLVKPGHTIYISGGTYTSGLVIGASGSSGNPITVKTGIQAPDSGGHGGKVSLPGISIRGHDHVVLDGRKDSSVRYTKNSEMADIASGNVYLIDNINMEVSQPNAIQVGCVYTEDEPNGTKILGMEIHHCSVGLSGLGSGQRDQSATAHGVYITKAAHGLEIAYNYIHHAYGDGINHNARGTENGWGSWSIHHNVIQNNFDDGIQLGGEVDVYNNVIRSVGQVEYRGHPDGVQFSGLTQNIRLYNNTIYDFKNALLRIETGTERAAHIWIYNNQFFAKEYTKAKGYPMNEGGMPFVAYSRYFGPPTTLSYCNGTKSKSGLLYAERAYWDDVLIANNLFANFDSSMGSLDYRGWDPATCTTPSGDWYIGELAGTNIKVANNIFYKTTSGAGGGFSVNVKPQSAGQISANNNLLFGLPSIGLKAGITESNTVRAEPFFRDVQNFNFHLLSNDLAATDVGENLSSYFSHDADGVARGSNWDIGPFENLGCGSSQPVALYSASKEKEYRGATISFDPRRSLSCSSGSGLTYEWDFGDGTAKVTNQGGVVSHTFSTEGNFSVALRVTNGNGAQAQYQKTIEISTAAEPGMILYLNFNNSISDQSGRGHIIAGTPVYDLNGKSGPGASISPTMGGILSTPNAADLSGMEQFSFAVWAKKRTASSAGAIIAKGSSYIFKVAGSGFQSVIKHNRNISAANADTNWHHYAVTYDGAKIKWFFDGQNKGEVAATGPIIPSTNTLTIGQYISETPFDGVIDELRLYNKGLSDAEVLAVYQNPPVSPSTKTLTVMAGIGGYVTSAPTGISCGSGKIDCTETLSIGAPLTLTVTRNAGYIFTGWSGDCSGITVTCSLSMGSDKNVTALFAPIVAPPSSALLLHLKFDDEFTDNLFTDSSPRGATARSISNANNPTKVTGIEGGAAELNWWYDSSIPETGRIGDCIANTDLTPFQHLSQTTISGWAHYYRAQNGNWALDGNANILSAGYAKAGAWDLGRYNGTQNTQFQVYLEDGKVFKDSWEFPDMAGVKGGDTGGWHHYLVTFNAGAVSLYFDGMLAGTGVSSARHLSVGGLRPWLAVGCKTHNGSFDPTDQEGGYKYPNHGWMNGSIDDIRIYNKILTPSEVLSLYDMGKSAVSNPLPPQTPETPLPPLDSTSPALTTINVTNISKNSATISWTTNEPATTQVQYGLTTAYGSITSLLSSLSGSHTQVISSLTASTTYHYRVISKDAAGNTAMSTNGIFSTAANPPATVNPLNSTPEVAVVTPPVLNVPPVDVLPRVVTVMDVPGVSPTVSPANTPAPAPTFLSRFIPSFTSTTKTPTTPSTVTKPRSTTGPFVPLPELTPEETVTTTKLSFTEQVRSILSYILQRIQNGFMRVLGR